MRATSEQSLRSRGALLVEDGGQFLRQIWAWDERGVDKSAGNPQAARNGSAECEREEDQELHAAWRV